ncbi:cytochrome P460 family protein [Granulicella sp. S190]|uniref:cytochrome P460 family protein n=1 Tax=Granulicella sp. S190 TaxID=1747226 RepID=UPI00131DBC1F|nr:cytochrome P460 family protein [Granulicella sp. S190]
MLRSALLLLSLAVLPQQETVRSYGDMANGDGLSYTADGQFKMPEKYREWIFLSSGLDMSYSPKTSMAGHSMFDNVFVNPSSYRVFQQTGTWPDKTTLVLEQRGAQGASSINKNGHTQSPEIMALEVHVKDAKLEGGWGFYEFDGSPTAKIVKRPASCYQCHESHAAVDTTFVQFYPTLLALAKSKGTLSPAYLKDISTPTQ